MSGDRRSEFGQLVYRKDRDSWIVRVPTGRRSPSGRPSYDVRKVKDEAEGKRLLREIRKARCKGTLRAHTPTLRQGAETLGDAVASYIAACRAVGRAEGTIEQYEVSAKGFRESGIGAKAVGAVTADDVRAYLVWRKANVWRGKKGGAVRVAGATASNAVLGRDRSLLASVYKWLVREGRTASNPAAIVAAPRKPETARRPFEPEELRAFLGACSNELRPLVLCGAYTGLGGRELVSLRWGNVSFAQKTISVVRQKNGKANVHPLHPHLEAELRRMREERTRESGVPLADAHVFLSRYGRAFRGFPREAWQAALRKAGLVGCGLDGPHSLRRTFATFWRGQDRDLMELLGHASLSTTLRYRKGREDRKRASVEALDLGLTTPTKRDATATA